MILPCSVSNLTTISLMQRMLWMNEVSRDLSIRCALDGYPILRTTLGFVRAWSNGTGNCAQYSLELLITIAGVDCAGTIRTQLGCEFQMDVFLLLVKCAYSKSYWNRSDGWAKYMEMFTFSNSYTRQYYVSQLVSWIYSYMTRAHKVFGNIICDELLSVLINVP